MFETTSDSWPRGGGTQRGRFNRGECQTAPFLQKIPRLFDVCEALMADGFACIPYNSSRSLRQSFFPRALAASDRGIGAFGRQ